MRLVSLTCSNTEIVCALVCGPVDGVDDIVIGRGRCNPTWGEQSRMAEKVADLKPDLVLASLTVGPTRWWRLWRKRVAVGGF